MSLKSLSGFFAITILTVASLTGTHAFAANSQASDPYPPVDVPFKIKHVENSNVYYVLGQAAVPDDRNAGFTSNAGFVVTKAGVVVFDALGTPSLGYKLLQAIHETTDQPVRVVVVSHYHADHMYGLQAFQDHTDAIIIAQDKASVYFNGEKSGIQGGPAKARLAQRQEALAPWVNDKTRVVKPDITFKDRLDMRFGDMRLKLYYAGPAHSPSDIMMMVQPSNVLFSGDIVQNHRVPVMFGDSVDTSNWLAGLEKVKQLQPRFIIPGHGQPSDSPAKAIQFTHDYISHLQDTMRKAVENWVDFDDAYKQADWSAYKDLPAFEEANKKNAYRAYLDMENSLFN